MKLLRGNTPVIAPFGGEHLYVTEEDFKRYVTAVNAFWTELSVEILRIYPGL